MCFMFGVDRRKGGSFSPFFMLIIAAPLGVLGVKLSKIKGIPLNSAYRTEKYIYKYIYYRVETKNAQ